MHNDGAATHEGQQQEGIESETQRNGATVEENVGHKLLVRNKQKK